MARLCVACTHERHDEINQALVNGEPLAEIARKFNIARTSVRRHRENHLPGILVVARDTLDTTADDNLFTRLVKKRKRADQIAHEAHDRGELRTALSAMAEARKHEELEARARGELTQGAIPRAELGRIMTAMGDIVAEHITDVEVLEAIRGGWTAIDV